MFNVFNVKCDTDYVYKMMFCSYFLNELIVLNFVLIFFLLQIFVYILCRILQQGEKIPSKYSKKSLP